MNSPRTDLRLALPSKGRLAEDTLSFLANCGLKVYQPNPRRYQATVPAIPGLTVIFQRPTDIVLGVRDGSLDFGITGFDLVAEKSGDDGEILVLHDALGFGDCKLEVAVPEQWNVTYVRDLAERGPLRVATKFPMLTERFFKKQGIGPLTLIQSEGTLEVAPALGHADLIVDLVASGQTLRDNRLRRLPDGVILESQACLIGNRHALQQRPEALATARQLLEFMEAQLRAAQQLLLTANMRGDSPEGVAARMFAEPSLGGLQGPTVGKVYVREEGQQWFSVQIVVAKSELLETVNAVRRAGGSGVIVTPVNFIFEEVPPRYATLLKTLEETA